MVISLGPELVLSLKFLLLCVISLLVMSRRRPIPTGQTVAQLFGQLSLVTVLPKVCRTCVSPLLRTLVKCISSGSPRFRVLVVVMILGRVTSGLLGLCGRVMTWLVLLMLKQLLS